MTLGSSERMPPAIKSRDCIWRKYKTEFVILSLRSVLVWS